MKLVVAFLCYNQSSAPYLPEFLDSLEISLSKVKAEILVLAGDNSDQAPYTNNLLIDQYNRRASFPVRLLSFASNLGFAVAYNNLIAVAHQEGADYFLMLNPDMLVGEEMVKELVSALSINKELAVVCPKIYRWDFANRIKTNILDSCGIIMRPGLRFSDLGQGELDRGQYDRANILGPSGAAACFRLDALRTIKEDDGYFDANFFMYKEDCDLAYRFYRAGLKSCLVPQATAYHDRSAASKGGLVSTWLDWRRRNPLTRSWSFVNQHRLFIKHWSREGLKSRFLIVVQVVFLGIFSLILAHFLLKSYAQIWRIYRGLD